MDSDDPNKFRKKSFLSKYHSYLRMVRSSALFAYLILFSSVSFSQSVFFEKTYGSEEGEVGRSIREFPDGSLYVAGWRENGPFGGLDFFLMKLDSAGNQLWSKFFGSDKDESCLYMTATSDGSLLLCGEALTDSNGLQGLVIKTDSSGNEIWRTYLGGPNNESLKFIEETSEGSYIATGFQNDAFGYNDSWFVKIDPAGAEIWSQAYGGPDTEYADGFVELPTSGYIGTGDTKSSGNGGYDVQLFRLDEGGVSLWDATYGDQFQNGCQGILLTADNHVLSFGETEVYLNSPYEIYLEKIDTMGNSKWRKTFGGNGTDAAFSAKEVSDGFVLTGYTTSLQAGPLNLLVAKADTGGNMVWMRSYGGNGIDIGYDIQVSKYGGFLIAGRKAEASEQLYVLHVNEQGYPSDILQQSKQPEIVLFPNPAKEGFRIIGMDESARIRLINMQGELKSECTGEQMLLPGSITNGVYLVEAVSRVNTVRMKLIINR